MMIKSCYGLKGPYLDAGFLSKLISLSPSLLECHPSPHPQPPPPNLTPHPHQPSDHSGGLLPPTSVTLFRASPCSLAFLVSDQTLPSWEPFLTHTSPLETHRPTVTLYHTTCVTCFVVAAGTRAPFSYLPTSLFCQPTRMDSLNGLWHVHPLSTRTQDGA